MKTLIILLKVVAYIWTAAVIGFITLNLIGIAIAEGFGAMIMQVINPISAALNGLIAIVLLVPGLVIHATATGMATSRGLKAEVSKGASEGFSAILAIYMSASLSGR